jgi:hypothetical protein
MNRQTLVQHKAIQAWVNAHRGHPAIIHRHDETGSVAPRLTLTFALGHSQPHDMPSVDDGISPVSWNAWLAELDRQNLALSVSPERTDFELIKRRELN